MSISASVLRPAPQTNTLSRSLRPLPAPRLLDLEHQEGTGCVYATVRQGAPAHISQALMDELTHNGRRIREGVFGPVRYRVLLSAHDGIFSLGGDLEHFLRCIRGNEPERLLAYGQSAVDGVWDNLSGCGIPDLTTIAVVQGEAQGGGFEAALSCHAIIAEQGCSFGFPESLFGLFPGMGAWSMIAARTDPEVADRMVSTPHRFPAEMLFELGLVDYLVPKGRGREFAEEIVTLMPSPAMRSRREALAKIRYNTLISSVERWVQAAMNLPPRQLRFMRYLLDAQRRRQEPPREAFVPTLAGAQHHSRHKGQSAGERSKAGTELPP